MLVGNWNIFKILVLLISSRVSVTLPRHDGNDILKSKKVPTQAFQILLTVLLIDVYGGVVISFFYQTFWADSVRPKNQVKSKADILCSLGDSTIFVQGRLGRDETKAKAAAKCTGALVQLRLDSCWVVAWYCTVWSAVAPGAKLVPLTVPSLPPPPPPPPAHHHPKQLS